MMIVSIFVQNVQYKRNTEAVPSRYRALDTEELPLEVVNVTLRLLRQALVRRIELNANPVPFVVVMAILFSVGLCATLGRVTTL